MARSRWLWAISMAALVLALAGCDLKEILGTSEDEERLPGTRLSVLALEKDLVPDPEIANEPVRLPRPVINESWPQQGGTANHAMHHLAGGDQLQIIWRGDLGSGENDDNLILSTPVIADGKVFVLDAESVVSALDLLEGEVVWEVDLVPEDEEVEASLGGGVAYAGGRLYVTTAYGHVVALDPGTGRLIWRNETGAPIRAGPTAAGGRVFAITFDNQLIAIDGDDGSTLWTHAGNTESAGLLGSAVPAVASDLVLAPYSSGELFALRVENGRVAWSDSLIFSGRLGARTTLSDIDGSPVIDRGWVFAVSHSGRLVALDLRSGRRRWDQEISSAQTPWIAGDYLYLMTTDGDVVCLRRADGRIRWVSQLPRFEDPEDREGVIIWSGPVLIGDRLVAVNNIGEALALSPYTGLVLGAQELPDGVRVPPVVANKTLYILTMEAELVALH